MKWVTRERPKTDRIACPWLIRAFIDPDAEFLYVPAEDVLEVAEREGAHSYDAPGAEYTHRDGLCSFEVLVEDYAIDDPAVHMLARIVHGADVERRPGRDAAVARAARGGGGIPPSRARRPPAARAVTAGLRRALRLVPERGSWERERRVSASGSVDADRRRRAAHPARAGAARVRLRARQRPDRRDARRPRPLGRPGRARARRAHRRRCARLARARPLRGPDRAPPLVRRPARRHGPRRHRVRPHGIGVAARPRRAHGHASRPRSSSPARSPRSSRRCCPSAAEGHDPTRLFGTYNTIATLAGSLGALAAICTRAVDVEAQRFLLVYPVAAAGRRRSSLRASRHASRRGLWSSSPSRGGRSRGRAESSDRLSGLFALDSFGGGFVTQAFLAYWFTEKWGTSTATLGVVFFAIGFLQAGSFQVAARLAGRIGLLNTMVFTHLPSNLLLALIPFAPSQRAAIALVFARFALSQMDVPTRQAYVVAVVPADERVAAAAYTNTARYVVRPIGALLSGPLLVGRGRRPVRCRGRREERVRHWAVRALPARGGAAARPRTRRRSSSRRSRRPTWRRCVSYSGEADIGHRQRLSAQPARGRARAPRQRPPARQDRRHDLTRG